MPEDPDIEGMIRALDDRIHASKTWISERLDGGLFTFVNELIIIDNYISKLRDIAKNYSGTLGRGRGKT